MDLISLKFGIHCGVLASTTHMPVLIRAVARCIRSTSLNLHGSRKHQ